MALHWAKSLLVPILLGLMCSYALTPAVNRLQNLRVPRPIGATVVLAAVVAVIGWGGWALADEAAALIDTLPRALAGIWTGSD